MLNRPVRLLPPTLVALSIGLVAQATLLFSSPARAELQDRELDGNLANGPEAYFDTELNVTWLRAASASAYDWQRANMWAQQDRFGIAGWGLPTLIDIGHDGCAPTGATTFGYSLAGPTDCGYNSTRVDEVGYYSQLAQLYYVALGNRAFYAPGTGTAGQPDWGLKNTSGFLGLQADYYWFDTQYVSAGSGNHWRFDMLDGQQFFGADGDRGFAIAVRSGDVASVPEPGAGVLCLFGCSAVALWRFRVQRRLDRGPALQTSGSGA